MNINLYNSYTFIHLDHLDLFLRRLRLFNRKKNKMGDAVSWLGVVGGLPVRRLQSCGGVGYSSSSMIQEINKPKCSIAQRIHGTGI